METIPYSRFKQYITEGNVGKLTIGPENINGTLKGNPEQGFTTVRVNDPGLATKLDEHMITYTGHYESKFWSSILSWVIYLGIFFLIWGDLYWHIPRAKALRTAFDYPALLERQPRKRLARSFVIAWMLKIFCPRFKYQIYKR